MTCAAFPDKTADEPGWAKGRPKTDTAMKMAPVPANAVMIRLAPLARPSTAPIRRDSIRPMKKVKASRIGTPAAASNVQGSAACRPKSWDSTRRPSP